ncbi:MAG: hypothetical protein IPG66_02250 [Hydrogenophilales bacterium]|nr:hypothetical protein [Hydrogenophilales bacterium]
MSRVANALTRFCLLFLLLWSPLLLAAHLTATAREIPVGESVLVKVKDVPLFVKIDWRLDAGLERMEAEGRTITLRGVSVGEHTVTVLFNGKPDARIAIKVQAPAGAPGESAATVMRGATQAPARPAAKSGPPALPKAGEVMYSKASADAPPAMPARAIWRRWLRRFWPVRAVARASCTRPSRRRIPASRPSFLCAN